jgi:vacuolar-type H+-ATPase subunit E/Vma4
MLLSLKSQITTLLEKVTAGEIAQTLSVEELARILSGLIKEACAHEAKDILILVKEQDKQQLEAHFLNKLRQETKKGIEVRASDQIRSGFIIIFDAGKSHFDFTDAALAEYVSRILKPKLAELLNQPQSA